MRLHLNFAIKKIIKQKISKPVSVAVDTITLYVTTRFCTTSRCDNYGKTCFFCLVTGKNRANKSCVLKIYA